MSSFKSVIRHTLLLLATILSVTSVYAAGSLQGTVLTAEEDKPLPGVLIVLGQTNQSATSGGDGGYKIEGIAAGSYALKATLSGFTTLMKTVEVKEGAAITVDFQMSLNPLAENVIVTASPYTQEALKTYQPTDSVTGVDLDTHLTGTLGDSLKEQPGVNMRSFGQGNGRPVIRGFDNDRVLILQDGARVGDLSSQSGDHAVPIDPADQERLEVVRGPASVLYGSNAIGGVVNAISDEMGHDEPFKGYNGTATVEYGTVNQGYAGHGHIDLGTGSWIFHVGGGGRNNDDYDTPAGKVENSQSTSSGVKVGMDYAAEKGHFGVSYDYANLNYGLPFVEAGNVSLDMKVSTLRFDGSYDQLFRPFPTLRVNVNYVDYNHKELEGDEIGTIFDNNTWSYRAFFDQAKKGLLTGTIGFSGLHRNYQTVGEEALAPFTIQNNFAGFAYEELGWERYKLQFGGRVEHNSYNPEELQDRTFDGFSGSVGFLANVTQKTVFATNYSHAYRAPALEELYNNGPHPGSGSFEIGNPNLNNELANTVDFSIRRESDRISGDFNYFYGRIDDFIFGNPTGEIEDDLPVVNIIQGDSRFYGFEAGINVGLTRWLFAKVGGDYVNAELTGTGEPLPRIPPLRGRFGIDLLYKGLVISPAVWVVAEQDRVFGVETPTPGYTLWNIRSAYTFQTQNFSHTITASLLNATNELYFNNLSFIKEFAPEPGRSFKITYSVNFY
jgi:iron complex outermembrane recepter protein